MKQEEVNITPTKSQSSDSRTITLLSHERKRKATVASLYDNDQIRGTTMRKAMEIEGSLKKTHHQCPTLIKIMMPSHVSTRFKLSLLKEFCDRHLPLGDEKIGLKGENGRVYHVSYLWRQHSLCGGWRAFAGDHGLEAGDVLVFQLVKPLNLKVYIVRANASKEVDAVKPEAGTSILEFEENNDTNSFMDDDDDDDDEFGNDDRFKLGMGFESGSDSYSIEVSKPKPDDFERRVKRFEEFKIVVNGTMINGELSELLRYKYYQLCLSQRSFLHRDLLEGLNVRIVSGMIADICDIADAIRAMSKVVPKKDLDTWGSKLKAFEKLGMNVGFLLERLRKLEGLAEKANGYERLMKERDGMKEELRNLEEQVLRVKGEMEVVDKEIEKLGVRGSGSIDRDFIQLANAAW